MSALNSTLLNIPASGSQEASPWNGPTIHTGKPPLAGGTSAEGWAAAATTRMAAASSITTTAARPVRSVRQSRARSRASGCGTRPA